MCTQNNVKQIYETHFVINEQGFPTGQLLSNLRINKEMTWESNFKFQAFSKRKVILT